MIKGQTVQLVKPHPNAQSQKMVWLLLNAARIDCGSSAAQTHGASQKRFWAPGSTVSVKFPVQEVATATVLVPLHSWNTQCSNGHWIHLGTIITYHNMPVPQ